MPKEYLSDKGMIDPNGIGQDHRFFQGRELLELMSQNQRRYAVIGIPENGVVVGLDLEGRIFVVVDNHVLNRVSPDAVLNRSDRSRFWNPGGDALWPGPEGTCFGYEYSTGVWRVPPSITGAVWLLRETSANHLVVEAEVDLINSQQLGIPVLLRREISIEPGRGRITVRVVESIRYLGIKVLTTDDFRLVPWSLCQFDWHEGCVYRFPVSSNDDVWDFYASSEARRKVQNGICILRTETDERFQAGIGEHVPWIEYIWPGFFRVRRRMEGPTSGHFADIADASPQQAPSQRGTKWSVYCDPSGFTELEACGGTLDTLVSGDETRVTTVTEYEWER